MRPGFVPKYTLQQKAAIGELILMADKLEEIIGDAECAEVLRKRAYILARNHHLILSFTRKDIDAMRAEVEQNGLEGMGRLRTADNALKTDAKTERGEKTKP